MKLKKIILTPSAVVELHRDELSAILKHAAAHYDWRCRAESRTGGSVYGWLNWTTDENPTIQVTVGFDMADLICKILEFSEHIALRAEFVQLIESFNKRYMNEDIS